MPVPKIKFPLPSLCILLSKPPECTENNISGLDDEICNLPSNKESPTVCKGTAGLEVPIPILPEDSVIIESATAEVAENLAILLAVPAPVIPPEGKVWFSHLPFELL